MRKLLVASQKSGVGKTTTSMNLAAATALGGTRVLLLDADPLSEISAALRLAEHPRRQSLRQIGIDLPGVLVSNIVPGLDVLSPYEEGSCSDADLDRLLYALSAPSCRQCYGCVLVDVPPFMGANPAQLIGSCDEFLLVMRAEPLAYRTLPAFLELVQRSSRGGHVLQLRGILLTLPEGEQPGCRWERELRGRFGARVRPEVIPFDETVGQALLAGAISSHTQPDSPAAHQYHQLVQELALAEEARPAASAEQIVQALREASTAPRAPETKERQEPAGESAAKRFTLPARPDHRPESAEPAAPPSSRKRRSGRSPSTAPSSSGRMAAANSPVTANTLGQLWPLWILLGAVLGGGLRFVPPAPSMLPVLVGLGVALLIVVALGATLLRDNESSTTARSGRGSSRPRERNSSTRPDSKTDGSGRFAALTKSKLKALRHDPNAN